MGDFQQRNDAIKCTLRVTSEWVGNLILKDLR